MTPIGTPNTPERREKARSRLRTATRGAIFAATGATVVIGIVISQEHRGSTTSAGTTPSASTGSVSTSGSGAAVVSGGSSATSGASSGSIGNTGVSGNTGTSSSPTISSASPAVTSGGSSS